MAKGNVSMSGIKAAKKIVYLFCISHDDFADQIGIPPFEATSGELKGKFIAFDEEHAYVYSNSYMDIKGLRNINVEFTPAFVEKRNLKLINQELEICNFEYSESIDPQMIPKVLRELMAENGVGFSKGTIVRTNVNWAALRVKKGDIGVVIDVYDLKQDGVQIIFSNGEHCGFSQGEQKEFLTNIGVTSNQGIKEYKFTNVSQLQEDFREGVFDAAFYDLH